MAVTLFTEEANEGKQNNVIKWHDNVGYTN
jgi:hypothetical protein